MFPDIKRTALIIVIQGEQKVRIHPVKYLIAKDRIMKLSNLFLEIKVKSLVTIKALPILPNGIVGVSSNIFTVKTHLIIYF